MTIYTIHPAPRSASGDPSGVVATPDAFSWAAFVFGPFWLAAKRLWLAAALWLVAALAFLALARLIEGAASGASLLLVALLLQTWFALEANDVLRRALDRGGRRPIDVVWAGDRSEALTQYFRRNCAAAAASNAPPSGSVARAVGAPFFGLFGDESTP